LKYLYPSIPFGVKACRYAYMDNSIYAYLAMSTAHRMEDMNATRIIYGLAPIGVYGTGDGFLCTA
jgi:hypothetical protein